MINARTDEKRRFSLHGWDFAPHVPECASARVLRNLLEDFAHDVFWKGWNKFVMLFEGSLFILSASFSTAKISIENVSFMRTH